MKPPFPRIFVVITTMRTYVYVVLYLFCLHNISQTLIILCIGMPDSWEPAISHVLVTRLIPAQEKRKSTHENRILVLVKNMWSR